MLKHTHFFSSLCHLPPHSVDEAAQNVLSLLISFSSIPMDLI